MILFRVCFRQFGVLFSPSLSFFFRLIALSTSSQKRKRPKSSSPKRTIKSKQFFMCNMVAL